MLMQVHEHVLFQSGLAIVDCYAVIVSVQAMDKRLDGRFVEMTEVGGCLTWLVAHHEGLRIDQPEGVDNHLTLDRLYWVNDNGDSAGCELFEGLLGVDVDRGEPAAETWM